MELAQLEKVNPMTVDFRGLSVTYNPDAFTEGFYYAVAAQFRKRFTEEIKASVEAQTEELPDDAPLDAKKVLMLVNSVADRIRLEGEKIEGEKAFYTALLVGTPDAPVLLEWDLTNDGVPVPCNEEGLKNLKHKTLEGLWETVRDAANPKSQGIATIPQNQTTSENTPLPSASPATPAEDDHLM